MNCMTEQEHRGVEDRWVSEKEKWSSLEEYVLFLKQKKAYQYAAGCSKHRRVLDFGCGSGYGTWLLSDHAREVIGVDISEEAIRHCAQTYRAPTLSFQEISPDYKLPFDDGSFDVIVSFQVIEHIPDVRSYLTELKRVLERSGSLFLTTPNRKYRLLPLQKPWNPEHFREYSSKSLERELSSVFEKVEILGVYGTEEINAIERGRVKQSPTRVYMYGPAIRALKAVLPASIISKLRKRAPQAPPYQAPRNALDPGVLRGYSLEDFTVGPDLLQCLDFLAIVQK